ncbi:MAG: Crp/Fnr family transcriptional regulator [Clostridiales bacterium]|nr:Crp/Fnr family transcriptional regulator [Clostridiales bacterium]
MPLESYFPFWPALSSTQRDMLEQAAGMRVYKKGESVHQGGADCIGLLIVQSGQLRVYALSEEGKEITLYRLLERDVCLFSASCILRGMQAELWVEAAADTQAVHIPAGIYQKLMQASAPVANYTNELMADRLSNVMWLLDQVLYKRMDARLAAFLIEESELGQSRRVALTHEAIARHLGTAREVVTRMLKYLQAEGAVTLSRGDVTLLDLEKLTQIAEGSIR